MFFAILIMNNPNHSTSMSMSEHCSIFQSAEIDEKTYYFLATNFNQHFYIFNPLFIYNQLISVEFFNCISNTTFTPPSKDATFLNTTTPKTI